jgi:toxin YoeB
VTLSFSSKAWADYLYWQESNPKIVERINELLKDVARSPFAGIGKPEPLKHEWRDYWSRRIDSKRRLVYRAPAEAILIAQCRFTTNPSAQNQPA